jgi:hypothetical protein
MRALTPKAGVRRRADARAIAYNDFGPYKDRLRCRFGSKVIIVKREWSVGWCSVASDGTDWNDALLPAQMVSMSKIMSRTDDDFSFSAKILVALHAAISGLSGVCALATRGTIAARRVALSKNFIRDLLSPGKRRFRYRC